MSNTDLIIAERSRDIGDFLVGRLIPFRKKRMVGPFIFIDHMGPSAMGPEKYLDVDQHPHLGLATLTYLLEGEVEHRDSLGTVQRIRPGSVNWMIAGKGVTHTERTPADLRQGHTFTLHGYQIWVALPRDAEETNPEFHHFAANELPRWTEGAADFKLVAGKGFGRQSPVPVHSPLFMVEIKAREDFPLRIDGQLQGEVGVCVVGGAIEACEKRIEAGNLVIAKQKNKCAITLKKNSHVILFGGEPFPEERHIHWNFVASEKDKIEAARKRWINKEFPAVPLDDSYVPLPGQSS